MSKKQTKGSKSLNLECAKRPRVIIAKQIGCTNIASSLVPMLPIQGSLSSICTLPFRVKLSGFSLLVVMSTIQATALVLPLKQSLHHIRQSNMYQHQYCAEVYHMEELLSTLCNCLPHTVEQSTIQGKDCYSGSNSVSGCNLLLCKDCFRTMRTMQCRLMDRCSPSTFKYLHIFGTYIVLSGKRLRAGFICLGNQFQIRTMVGMVDREWRSQEATKTSLDEIGCLCSSILCFSLSLSVNSYSDLYCLKIFPGDRIWTWMQGSN